MFQDEARFGRINEIKRCWAPSGVRPDVIKQIVREYTYSYCAVSPKDGVADFLILPSMTKFEMNIFLKEVSERHKEELILMFMDGAPSHKDIEVPENMIIKNIPAYCPQLNPVENMWGDMREKFFTNEAFNSMDDVRERLIYACLHYESNPEISQSISGFNWILLNL